MAHTDPGTLVPKLVLELANDEGNLEREEFLAYTKANQWALMQNAQASRPGATQTETAASLYQLAISSILPGDRERFEAWMYDHGRDDQVYDKLYDALNALWAGETRLPLEPTSSDSPTPTSESGPTSTDDSSEPESERTEWDTVGQIQAAESIGSSTPDLISAHS